MAEQRITIATPAGDIAAWRGGTGRETAVLLHGGPGMSDYLDTLLPLVGGRFRTVRYQQRGLPRPRSGGRTRSRRTSRTPSRSSTGGRRPGLDRRPLVGRPPGPAYARGLPRAHRRRGDRRPAGRAHGRDGGVRREPAAGLDEPTRRRLDEIEAREDAGEATAEESLESFATRSGRTTSPIPPPRRRCRRASSSRRVLLATFASVAEHAGRGTLTTGLPHVPASIPVLFVHGRAEPDARCGRHPTRPR